MTAVPAKAAAAGWGEECFAGAPAVQHLALYPESREIPTGQMLLLGLNYLDVEGASFLTPENSVKSSKDPASDLQGILVRAGTSPPGS